nr:phospholipid carrier-dependent glycosyltransferase [Paraoerskovia sediminicola]
MQTDPREEPPTGSSTGSDDGAPATDLAPTVVGGTRSAAHERMLELLLGARTLALGATANDRLWAWLGPALVTLVAGVLRLWNLGHPHELVFDETYYVKDSWTLLNLGYEGSWPDDPNAAFEAGQVDGYLPEASYVVHPQLGKWMIALGMAGPGAESSFGWRVSAAVVGTLAVFLLARVARRLFASTAMGVAAGALLAVDGEAIVLSRITLLDGFLMFWVLVAFWCILRDRDSSRRRLASKVADVLDSGGAIGRYGPRLGWRWWRFAAAVALGLACGTKWSGLYFLAALALLSVLWDATARRKVGVKRWWEDTFMVDAVPAALIMLPTALLTYLATWASWFASSEGYMRQWAATHPGEGVTWLPESLRSFWEYHVSMWTFHTGLSAEHPYASNPWGWPLQLRPTSFYFESFDDGSGTCGADRCVEAISAVGNPAVWWLGTVALLVTVWFLVRRFDWRASAVLVGLVAGWVPWLLTPDRTIFTFYSVVFVPWMVLALVYAMTLALEHTEGRATARRRVRWGIGIALALAGLAGAYFYPLWSGMQVSYEFWHQHMWLTSWI